MKIILVDQRHGHTKTIVLKGWAKGLLSVMLLGVPVALGYLGFELAVTRNPQVYNEKTAHGWDQQLKQQAEELAVIKQQSQEQLEALTIRLAMLQARLMRLDAVGERVTTIANLDSGEFDFSQPVGLGGPEQRISSEVNAPQFIDAIAQLELQLNDRQQQLEILEGLLDDRKIQADVFIAGRPVEKGWISSRFGRRIDPITGKLAMHEGVDFSADRGSEINTVAAGVVTWSAARSEYGLMVEVNHGNGYTTRYAHADQLMVGVGDIVQKGQIIALVGNTGRSTGPHVHFEVFKNGRVVDPASYIHRTAR